MSSSPATSASRTLIWSPSHSHFFRAFPETGTPMSWSITWYFSTFCDWVAQSWRFWLGSYRSGYADHSPDSRTCRVPCDKVTSPLRRIHLFTFQRIERRNLRELDHAAEKLHLQEVSSNPRFWFKDKSKKGPRYSRGLVPDCRLLADGAIFLVPSLEGLRNDLREVGDRRLSHN